MLVVSDALYHLGGMSAISQSYHFVSTLGGSLHGLFNVDIKL